MWELEETVVGLAVACGSLELPIVSGNVSLYNQTSGRGIPPTPAVGIVGKLSPDSRPIPCCFTGADHIICVLHSQFADLENPDSLVGSIFEERLSANSLGADHMGRGNMGGGLQPPDLDGMFRLGQFIRKAHSHNLPESVRAISGGGLAVTLARCSMNSMMGGQAGIGAQVDLDLDLEIDIDHDPALSEKASFDRSGTRGSVAANWMPLLFGEHIGMFVASFRENSMVEIRAMAQTMGVQVWEVGRTGGDALTIRVGDHLLSMPVSRLSNTWRADALPGLSR